MMAMMADEDGSQDAGNDRSEWMPYPTFDAMFAKHNPWNVCRNSEESNVCSAYALHDGRIWPGQGFGFGGRPIDHTNNDKPWVGASKRARKDLVIVINLTKEMLKERRGMFGATEAFTPYGRSQIETRMKFFNPTIRTGSLGPIEFHDAIIRMNAMRNVQFVPDPNGHRSSDDIVREMSGMACLDLWRQRNEEAVMALGGIQNFQGIIHMGHGFNAFAELGQKMDKYQAKHTTPIDLIMMGPRTYNQFWVNGAMNKISMPQGRYVLDKKICGMREFRGVDVVVSSHIQDKAIYCTNSKFLRCYEGPKRCEARYEDNGWKLTMEDYVKFMLVNEGTGTEGGFGMTLVASFDDAPSGPTTRDRPGTYGGTAGTASLGWNLVYKMAEKGASHLVNQILNVPSLDQILNEVGQKVMMRRIP